jgi:hypothetical protein
MPSTVIPISGRMKAFTAAKLKGPCVGNTAVIFDRNKGEDTIETETLMH